MWWKKNKWKVIVPIMIVAVLVTAFYFGGNAPGSVGWSVSANTGDDTPVVSASPEAEANVPTPGPVGEDALSESESDGEQAQTPEDTEVSPEPSEAEDPEDETQETADKEPETTPPTEAATEAVPEATMAIDPETGLDKYQTEPVPEGKPLPVEPQDVTIGSGTYSCTISINCAVILDNMEFCDPEKVELVPEDGWILEPLTVTFYEGESVFNVLQRVCKQNKIHMEYMDTPIYNSAYIEGIHNLYEFDVGELSGWMYNVNGWFPNYGCSRYQLQDGDVIEWVYTCDLGEDVGGGYAAGNK